jgi:hypothetical protein
MRISRDLSLRVLLCLSLLSALPGAAAAVEVYGGWTRSDVGLHAKGEGLYLGVGNAVPTKTPILDVMYSLEYVQKVGSQPTAFADIIGGPEIYEDAKVTLHYLQPSIFVGAKVPALPVIPRVFGGLSIGLKVKESWDEFPGITASEYGYKNTDIVGHLGFSLGLGPVAVQVRYSFGFTGQLLRDNRQPVGLKADDPLAGVKDPEVGAKISTLHLGAAFGF